jgi:hypothetical protein
LRQQRRGDRQVDRPRGGEQEPGLRAGRDRGLPHARGSARGRADERLQLGEVAVGEVARHAPERVLGVHLVVCDARADRLVVEAAVAFTAQPGLRLVERVLVRLPHQAEEGRAVRSEVLALPPPPVDLAGSAERVGADEELVPATAVVALAPENPATADVARAYPEDVERPDGRRHLVARLPDDGSSVREVETSDGRRVFRRMRRGSEPPERRGREQDGGESAPRVEDALDGAQGGQEHVAVLWATDRALMSATSRRRSRGSIAGAVPVWQGSQTCQSSREISGPEAHFGPRGVRRRARRPRNHRDLRGWLAGGGSDASLRVGGAGCRIPARREGAS